MLLYEVRRQLYNIYVLRGWVRGRYNTTTSLNQKRENEVVLHTPLALSRECQKIFKRHALLLFLNNKVLK